MEYLKTKIYGDVIAVAAEWEKASAPIFVNGDDDEKWIHTGWQVADFRHSPHEALRQVLRDLVRGGGDDPDDDECSEEIEAAMAAAVEGDDDDDDDDDDSADNDDGNDTDDSGSDC